MKIGLLTGGGDVPGLNPCIRGLVYRAVDEGHEVIGIRRGWLGLVNINPDDPSNLGEYIMPLNKQNTRTINRTGGTVLHTSRTNPEKMKVEDLPDFLKNLSSKSTPGHLYDLTSNVLRVIEYLGIDMLVAIGGDDTLSFASRLYMENVPIVGIPKTMDNDVHGTDYTIGFSTAITRSVELIKILRTSSGSHERLAVVELFGRKSGATCWVTAYVASVDRAIIPEVPFDPEKLSSLLVEDRLNNASRYAMLVISEGARFLNTITEEYPEADKTKYYTPSIIGRITADIIQKTTKVNTLYQHLAYLMRSGEPDSLDLMVAINFANVTMDLINSRNFGKMVALQEGRYTHIPIITVIQGEKRVDVDEFYDRELYRPKVRSILNKPMFFC